MLRIDVVAVWLVIAGLAVPAAVRGQARANAEIGLEGEQCAHVTCAGGGISVAGDVRVTGALTVAYGVVEAGGRVSAGIVRVEVDGRDDAVTGPAAAIEALVRIASRTGSARPFFELAMRSFAATAEWPRGSIRFGAVGAHVAVGIAVGHGDAGTLSFALGHTAWLHVIGRPDAGGARGPFGEAARIAWRP